MFAARRLYAEPIALLIAAREGDPRRFDAPGLDALELGGLGADAARALLTTRLPGAADDAVVDRLLRTARGNPLALLELPDALTESQLEGSEPILGPPPVRGAVEAAFAERVAGLPAPTRMMLLLAAADEDDDVATIARAAAHLDLDLAALDAAERDGLVRADGEIVFRHPVVRSAVYRSATRAERRMAHQALAAVLEDPARRAWHRALVAERADEAIGAELEAAAAAARRRGAQATASATFERAAELTENPMRKGHRLRCAAQASLDSGRPDTALALAERARPFVADPVDGAELQLVRLTVGFARGTPDELYGLLMETAASLRDADPDRALEVLTALAFVAGMGGRWEDGIADTRRAIDGVRAAPELQGCMRAFVDGATLLVAGDPAGARPRLEEAVGIGARFGRDPLLAVAGLVCLYVGDASRAHDLFDAAMAERQRGARAPISPASSRCSSPPTSWTGASRPRRRASTRASSSPASSGGRTRRRASSACRPRSPRSRGARRSAASSARRRCSAASPAASDGRSRSDAARSRTSSSGWATRGRRSSSSSSCRRARSRRTPSSRPPT